MIDADRAFLTAFRLRQDLGLLLNSCTDLDYITNQLMIRVRRADLGLGIEGACRSQGIKRLVILSPHPYNENKERFTLSHEIGHLLIHHGSHLCEEDFFKIYQTQNDIEQEANYFAAELLLPRSTMVGFLKNKDLSFSLVEQIATTFKTTISAAIIRLTQLYDDSAVVIYHDGLRANWRVRSRQCFLKMSSRRIPTISLCNVLCDNKIHIKGSVDPKGWIDDEIDDLICEEETHYFSKLKKYLTILKFYEDV